MQVREATTADGETIRSVAARSMEASYSLGPSAIESAIEQWYADDALAEKLDDSDDLVLVGEADGEVVAFAESVRVDDRGDILWLHVQPSHRGHGIGDDLFDATGERLREAGANTVRGRVLADNDEGNRFYERHGLSKAGESEVEIDGRRYVENVYVADDATGLVPFATEGRQLYVDPADADRGAKGAFLAVYSDDGRGRRYGYYCDNCDSLVTSMDSMGRLECNECGNVRKPTRWDAAYL